MLVLCPWQRSVLRDNWTLFFCPQLTLWISDKLLTSQDVPYDKARNLHNLWLKHQAFVAELASHQGWLESIDAVSKASSGGAQVMYLPEWAFTQGVDTVLKLTGQYRTWK